MKTARPVFESFEEFVNFMTESIEGDYDSDHLSEAENDPEEGGSDKLQEFRTDLIGVFGKDSRSTITELSSYLNGFISDADKTFLEECVKGITSFTGRKEENKITRHSYGISETKLGVYEWSFAGTCTASAYPIVESDGKVKRSESSKDEEYMPIGDLLLNINKANFRAFSDALKAYANNKNKNDAEGDLRKLSNVGIKGKAEIDQSLFIIEKESLKKKIIQVKQYESPEYLREFDKNNEFTVDTKSWRSLERRWNNVNQNDDVTKFYKKAYEAGFSIPFYYIDPTYKIVDSKNAIGVQDWVRVLPSAGSSTPVTDKEFSPDAESKFFESNKTVLSAKGKGEMRAFLSNFNKVTKIVVTGGASSFSTTYTSPIVEKDAELKKKMGDLATKNNVLVNNLYLAYDRMLASYNFFISLLKEDPKPEQFDGLGEENITYLTPEDLVSLKDKDGNFLVQRKDEEGDVKKQQTSFKMDGLIKNISGQADDKPVILKGQDKIFAKNIQIKQGMIKFKLVLGKPPRKTKTEISRT